MKKISIIFTGLHGEEYHPDSGGIELAEYSFSEYASSLGHQVTAIVGTSYNKTLTLSENKASVVRIPTQPFCRGGLTDCWSFAHQAASIVTEKILGDEDVIHFTSLIPAMAFISNQIFNYLLTDPKNRSKFFYTLHNYHYSIADKPEDIFVKFPEEWRLLYDGEMQIIKSVNSVFVSCDNYTQSLSIKYGRHIKYLPNTIGESSNYKNENFNIDKFTILLSMARISPEKNLDLLIKAFAKSSKNIPNLRLIIAGDGEDLAQLIKLAKQLNIKYTNNLRNKSIKNILSLFDKNQLIFLGRIDTILKQHIWNLADCFILLSKREVCPLVGLEGLVYGKRMIASNIPGWQDYKDRKADINLVDSKNTDDDIVNTIIKSVKNIKKDRLLIRNHNLEVYQKYYQPSVVIPKRLRYYETDDE